ncbi:MAG: YegS/Rv2252/BmrU family lipid kinase [Lachnospiraceae bacterium]|nr:YegS/Rv2252/BmrU family lipid kinase [Lachnospiraceae bacterium]
MINLIINERSSSGNGKLVGQKVREILEEKNVEYNAYVTESVGHATRITKDLCEQNEGEVTIVVVGGDGTINEVVNGITDFDKVRLGIIPTGSGNDFARGMGLLKGTTSEHLERILKSEGDFRIDLGKVTYGEEKKTKLFAISSGVGMDALVCKKVATSNLKKTLNKFHLGKFTYIIITVQSLFTMKCADSKCRFEGKDDEKYKKLVFLAAMNFYAEGGGVPMAPKATATDGKLSICSCFGVSKLGAFIRLPLLMMKKHENLKCFNVFDTENGEIILSKPMALHTDGEYLEDVKRVKYESIRGILRFIM